MKLFPPTLPPPAPLLLVSTAEDVLGRPPGNPLAPPPVPAGCRAEQEALLRPRRDVSAAEATPCRNCCCCPPIAPHLLSPPLLPPPVRPGGDRERSIALCRKSRLRMRCGGLLQASLPSASSSPSCRPGTIATAGEDWGRWLCPVLLGLSAFGPPHSDVVSGRCMPPPPLLKVAVAAERTGFLTGANEEKRGRQ